MFSIYYIFCPNDKGYVGFTSETPEARWKEHVKQARNGSPYLLHKAIRKYGPNAFMTMLVWQGASWQDVLNKREEHYIRKFGTHFSTGNGYNMTYGGQGGIGRKKTATQKAKEQTYWTKEHRQEHSEKLSGINNPMYGRKGIHPNQKVFHGSEHPCYGKKMSDETKQKIRQTKLGKKWTPEQRQTIMAARALKLATITNVKNRQS